MLRKIADSVLRPQVRKFVFESALKTKPADVLRGSAVAAANVSRSIATALDARRTAPLDELLARGLVESRLHEALATAVNDGQGSSTDGRTFAPPVGEPSLTGVRLVLGPDRAECGARGADLRRVTLGGCLVVIGGPGDALYGVNTQRRLLSEHGAAVQVDVAFANQTWVFEAHAPAAQFASRDADAAYDWRVADINGVADGNAYWADLVDVPRAGLRDYLFSSS